LTSTAITATSAGSKSAELRYKAWGETRYTYGTTPTTYHFTGQREESTIGLYFYNARWYDAALGRFVQADTIVSDPGNPQSLNRYTYVYDNPVKYTDPTGMFTEKELVDWGAYTYSELERLWRTNPDWYRLLLVAQLGDSVRSFSKNGSTFGSGCFTRDNSGKLMIAGEMTLNELHLPGQFTAQAWSAQFTSVQHELAQQTDTGHVTLDSQSIRKIVDEMTPGYIRAPLVPVPRPGERKTSLEKSFAVAFFIQAGASLELIGTEIVHAAASTAGWPRAGGMALGYTIKGFGFWVWALAYNQAQIPMEQR